MNSNTAIKVENVSKIYKLYNAPIDRMKESLHWRGKKYHKDFYALNDISFEIKKGETVGIVGKNGSGKSTLLKIITGVLSPSSGNVRVSGKVSALLELGAGFNPEYTGIENIYFQANLMGYSKKDIDAKLDSILKFADIGSFIYQPVKVYSSGMFARLAFAVAINVEPDILIVDEALSVGDMVFQAKCMAHMTKMMENGVTVLFVSHDPHSIKTLCQKALFLDNGYAKSYGNAADVVNKYIEMQHMQMGEQLNEIDIPKIENCEELYNDSIPKIVTLVEKPINKTLSQRYGDKRATILDAVILDTNFKQTNELIANNNYYIQIAVRFNENLPTFVCGAMIVSLDGVQQIGCLSSQDGIALPAVKKDEVYIVNIAMSVPIKAGTYTLTVAIELPNINNIQHQILDMINKYLVLKVNFENPKKQFYSNFYTKGQYFLQKVINQHAI